MGPNMWCILASIVIVSVGANRYDRGPQKFYDVSFDSATSEQNENKEVILFLTPDQVRALEAEGAVVRSSESSENEENESAQPQINEDDPAEQEVDEDESAEPQVNEDLSEVTEQGENDDTEQEQDAQQEQEQENSEDIQDQDLDIENILRLLNEEQVEEEETEEASEELARNEPQVEEENTEKPRNFSPKFSFRQQLQQEQRYLAPVSDKKEQILKSYSSIRYQPNEPQMINLHLQQQSEANNPSEKLRTEGPTQERKKYKLVPYEVHEAPEEPTQEENVETQQNAGEAQNSNELNSNRLAEIIGLRKIKLQQNELQLQSILRELKASPKHNDQKYAIEIQRLKANLEKQNALSKAEAIAKIAPSLIKQQISKKRLLNKPTKQEKSLAPETYTKTQQKKKNTAAPTTTRPIPVPVFRSAKPEAPRPIPVPVETDKRPSVKNTYAKGRTDKLFTISRRTPQSKKQELLKSRPERITIVRQIWEN